MQVQVDLYHIIGELQVAVLAKDRLIAALEEQIKALTPKPTAPPDSTNHEMPLEQRIAELNKR